MLLGSVGWADAVLQPHAGSNDGNAAIEFLREVVICGCSGFFRDAAKGKTGLVAALVILGAFGSRAAAAPVVLPHAMVAICI